MNLEAVAAQLAQTIQKEANINAIFGEPKQLDQHTIIPVARIKVTLAGAGGGGKGPAPGGAEGGDAPSGTAGGTGGGGGMDIEVQPIGFIRDGADGAEFVAIDPTPEGLLGKVGHLLEGLRTGAGKPTESGH